jgi:hypothetical protein
MLRSDVQRHLVSLRELRTFLRFHAAALEPRPAAAAAAADKVSNLALLGVQQRVLRSRRGGEQLLQHRQQRTTTPPSQDPHKKWRQNGVLTIFNLKF